MGRVADPNFNIIVFINCLFLTFTIQVSQSMFVMREICWRKQTSKKKGPLTVLANSGSFSHIVQRTELEICLTWTSSWDCFVRLLFQKSRHGQNYYEMPSLFVTIFPCAGTRTGTLCAPLSLNQVLTVTSQPARFIQMATHVCIQQHRSQLLGRLTGPSRVQPPCLCWQLLLLRTPAVHGFPLSSWRL